MECFSLSLASPLIEREILTDGWSRATIKSKITAFPQPMSINALALEYRAKNDDWGPPDGGGGGGHGEPAG